MTVRKMRSLVLLVILIVLSCGKTHAQGKADYHALMTFKQACDKTNKLTSWVHRNPCKRRWYGVGCDNGRVVRLVLENMGLTGSIQPLTGLTELRILSLKNNSFDTALPQDIASWTYLKLLFLSNNRFSGPIPSTIVHLDRLLRLDVGDNVLIGEIPESIASLTSLMTLRLENNQFSGSISNLMIPSSVEEFNVSMNMLSGNVPLSLSRFPPSSFEGNDGLCGYPLDTCVSDASTRPHFANTTTDKDKNASTPYGSPPSSASSGLSKGDIVAIVVGDVAVLSLIACVLVCYCWRNKNRSKKIHKAENTPQRVTAVSCSNSSHEHLSGEKLRLVFFEEGRPFELENLLRASAEMLGKGNFGSAYKAVMEDGSVVAVKRLKDVHAIGRKEFEMQMDVMGRFNHPNVLSLRAYYYAKDEKLLVYNYMPNGSLHSLLHGCRGPGRTPLDWTTRMKIALEAARGLAYIHSQCKSPKIGHGNIKSSNILLDKDGHAKVSDFGVAAMVTPSVAASRMAGYRAPEQGVVKKISHKADVYSFGVVLLEILTGKTPSSTGQEDEVIDLPRWVQSIVKEEWTSEVFDIELMRFKNIEEELTNMLQIALLCASPSPIQRPKMCHVVKMIHEIKDDFSLIQSPSMPDHSDSPSISEDSTL